SVFDGAHAFLFSGNVSNDTIYGEFRSGKHYKSNWMAVRDDEFTLTNPSDMTKAVDEKPIAFAFPNSEGSQTDINDPKYKSKYKLINIMGTWCPNCRDEINFLKEVQAKHPNIEIISIAFEKYRDTEKAMAILKKYKSQMNFDWPILLGGYANKKETGETFEFLDKIYSYPTLLLVDDNNKIIDIHTGFNGPATSEYQAFKKDYYSKLAGLNI
ncbi:MAG: TlpA family protein disulfide reductase, partial [Bacteroidia bacterium]|nr:TlpA family protein disulfide reductase [Bacteroidia bacterium]